MSALISLAGDINREHLAAQECANRAIEHARRAGDLLLQAKESLNHGEWLPWLAANVQFSERTAQSYMRVARELPKLDAAKAQRVADLPLRDALKALAEPEDGASIVRRLHSLATDLADDEFDDDLATARMREAKDEAEKFIDATTDIGALARIAEATKFAEMAAAFRRVRAMRMLGSILSASTAIEKAMATYPEAKAFIGGPAADGAGMSVVFESPRHPGFWHYATFGVGEGVRTNKPVRLDALPTALAMLGAFRPQTFVPAPYGHEMFDIWRMGDEVTP